MEQGTPDEALPVLRKAPPHGDPPPAVPSDLCGLLADRCELDELFRTLDVWRHIDQERVKRWGDIHEPAQLDRHLEGPGWCALGLASRQAGKGDLAASLPFLDCLLPWMKAQGMEDAYWQARGLTGVAHEQAGDVDTALRHSRVAWGRQEGDPPRCLQEESRRGRHSYRPAGRPSRAAEGASRRGPLGAGCTRGSRVQGIEWGEGPALRRRGAYRERLGWPRLYPRREPYRERRTLGFTARDLNPTAVAQDDLLTDRQAEATPALA